jgi:DNA polymerase alpha subunit A
MLTACPTERALLSCLLTRLTALDVDVLVGHNISAFDLSVLLHRLQHHKVGDMGCLLAACDLPHIHQVCVC